MTYHTAKHFLNVIWERKNAYAQLASQYKVTTFSQIRRERWRWLSLPLPLAELKVVWLWGHLQLASILMFLQQLIKSRLFFHSTALLRNRNNRPDWLLSFRGKLDTAVWLWTCDGCAQATLEVWCSVMSLPGNKLAQPMLVVFPVFPSWGGTCVRPARCSYSCLLSGQGGLALAEVHLFMLLTNFQRNFIGWGEWRVK